LDSGKTYQCYFLQFLFHRIEVAVSNGFTREKNLFHTIFAQRKSALWKSCGMCFQKSDTDNYGDGSRH
jgi:hypothetical protein